MRTIEATGKSIDEAIFKGLQQMEISIDQVEIEILQHESKGVFGIGSKPAVVRLTEREEERILFDDIKPDIQDEQNDLRRGAARKSDERAGQRQRERYGKSRGGKTRGEKQHADRTPRPSFDYSLDAAKDNPAALFLKELLDKMQIKCSVLAFVQDNDIRLRIDSDTMGILIGHRGETLDALQYLTSLAVNRGRKDDGFIRVTLDTENYRLKREETLQRLARKIASQVKATGRPRALEPMNPYERRVLHATLQNNPYVSTCSEGTEPNRRVVISPKQNGV
ncbi:MAG: R3H domain protein [Firmicutes bacterium ADurb.Bin182]|nr:MAG: R3H domain protein [Firmicutes bacterium ADurb.Bin182]